MLQTLAQTLHHFVPDLSSLFLGIPDPRQIAKTTYSLNEILSSGLLTILLKQGSRNGFNELRSQQLFVKNACHVFDLEGLPHGDTVADVLKALPSGYLAGVNQNLMKRLIRSKTFDPFRLLDQWVLVAVDGTGLWTFNERHCEHCLTKKQKDGSVLYYHYVLEYKLVTANGFSLSLLTEFVENESEDVSKQDCEIKAFYRSAPKLKKLFPQLRICLLCDSLSAAEPVFDICRKNDWAYIIMLKNGKIPTITDEFETLRPLASENRLRAFSDPQHTIIQDFSWVNEISYQDHEVNVFECLETKVKTTRFRWVTNIPITANNVIAMSNEGGRLRWKIENEGFNTQKNGGSALEHVFSLNYNAQKNYYFLVQIACLIAQLVEKGKEIQQAVKKGRRTLKRLWEDLRAELTHGKWDWAEVFRVALMPTRISFVPSSWG